MSSSSISIVSNTSSKRSRSDRESSELTESVSVPGLIIVYEKFMSMKLIKSSSETIKIK